MRVLVYCTSDLDSPNPDIGFPSQIELKVNAETFQGNLRGIKKKVGTTRPADITSLVRRIPNYNNQLSITYAATERVSLKFEPEPRRIIYRKLTGIPEVCLCRQSSETEFRRKPGPTGKARERNT